MTAQLTASVKFKFTAGQFVTIPPNTGIDCTSFLFSVAACKMARAGGATRSPLTAGSEVKLIKF